MASVVRCNNEIEDDGSQIMVIIGDLLGDGRCYAGKCGLRVQGAASRDHVYKWPCLFICFQ